MHIAITGATGFIGSGLVPFLVAGGHEVTRVTRRPPRAPDEVTWDPAAGRMDEDALRGVDAVVHLAGEPIAAGRWTEQRKRRIRDSRVQGTALLARTMAGTTDGPRVLVGSSGIDYYGDRGDEVLTEDSAPGDGFLAEVCVAWEAAADAAREAGVRVVHLRTGIVLSAEGGALPRLLLPFRLGLGGRFGSGRQYWSWITIDDMIGLIAHALASDGLAGPVNAVAPSPVTNAEFTRTLAGVLSRPAALPVPRFAPRLVLGELADSLLYASQRALPERAEADGYVFRHANLEEALRHVLARPSRCPPA
ncbi:MAG TPA: TIGR01777 family oxidoreductase [Egibacteraceae bacterium]|nr:TIGR01777 family oxidoreductase [Egibacteraceae bacterium]